MAKYVSVDKLLYFKQKLDSLFALKTEIPTKTSQLTNDSGFKTTDNNTTYTLSKSGSTITLTGSDGKTTSVTDSNTTYSTATTSANGLMSSTDKSKLDGIRASADAVTYTQSLTSGTKVGTININGTDTILYAPTATTINNTLTSTSTSQALSANQGKVLNDKITSINNAISGITSFNYEVVTSLPTTGVKGTIYLVAHSHGTNDSYDEYIWINDKYEKIGNTDIDLSNYYLKTDLVECANSDIDGLFS